MNSRYLLTLFLLGILQFLPQESFARVFNPQDSEELLNALQNVTAGDTIELEPKVYDGNFIIRSVVGTREKPIILRGTNDSIISNVNGTMAFVLYLYNVHHWKFEGFTIRSGPIGLIADHGLFNTFTDLHFTKLDSFALLFRMQSVRNVVEKCHFYEMGRKRIPWMIDINQGKPQPEHPSVCLTIGTDIVDTDIRSWDQSNENIIRENQFGPNVFGLFIEIKEGTYRNRILGNQFIGPNMPEFEPEPGRQPQGPQARDQREGTTWATSVTPEAKRQFRNPTSICGDPDGCWVEINGDETEVRENFGESDKGSGFLTWNPDLTLNNPDLQYVSDKKWGCSNRFANNSCSFLLDGTCVRFMNEDVCSNFDMDRASIFYEEMPELPKKKY